MNLEVPLNQTSLGQVGYGVAVEFFRRDLHPNFFPIGNVNLTSFSVPEGFEAWLQNCIQKSFRKLRRDDQSMRIWHIGGSHHRLSDHTTLFTVHETDRLTEAEKAICRQHDRVLVTSNYSVDVFRKSGIEAEWCPNPFDKDHFFKTEVNRKGLEGVVQFGLNGKIERRKHTVEILKLWCELFGGNKDFRLNCCVQNIFTDIKAQEAQIIQGLGGKPPWNVNFIPYSVKNSDYNLSLNNNDIDLTGLSGAEGWNLPSFQSIALGKLAIVLDAHAHKDFARPENCLLVESEGKCDLVDPPFYIPGADYNQGRMFSFPREGTKAAMLKAVEMLPTWSGEEGEKLAEEFSAARTVDILLANS